MYVVQLILYNIKESLYYVHNFVNCSEMNVALGFASISFILSACVLRTRRTLIPDFDSVKRSGRTGYKFHACAHVNNPADILGASLLKSRLIAGWRPDSCRARDSEVSLVEGECAKRDIHCIIY